MSYVIHFDIKCFSPGKAFHKMVLFDLQITWQNTLSTLIGFALYLPSVFGDGCRVVCGDVQVRFYHL